MRSKNQGAFTVVEVTLAIGIAAVTIGGIVTGHIFASRNAEWSSYSLAAQSLAVQRMEQARSANWDLLASPPRDQLTSANFPTTNEILDVPISGTNIVNARIYTTITPVSTNVQLRLIRVDCVWPFMNRGLFTNSIQTYRAPDQQ